MNGSPDKLGLFGWLDHRAERKEARRLLLIERGLDWRSITCQAARALDSRLVIAGTIIGLFAWAFARTTDRDTANLMVGALIAAFAGAWGYYLGSSSSAATANDRADRSIVLGQEIVKRLPKPEGQDIELEPGESTTISAESEQDGEERRAG